MTDGRNYAESLKTAGQTALQNYAWEDVGQCNHADTYNKSVRDFTWQYNPALPINLVRGTMNPAPETPEDARQWLADEARHQDEEGRNGTEYYQKMAEWWTATPDEPIIVSEHGGLYYIWGGYHRHAISVIHGHGTIPAVVGTPKLKETR